MKKLTLVQADGWEALYADGELVAQDHSIDWSSVLPSLGYDIDKGWAQDYIDRCGSYPTDLSEVTFDE